MRISSCVHEKQKREDQYARLRSINNGEYNGKMSNHICPQHSLPRTIHIQNVSFMLEERGDGVNGVEKQAICLFD